MNKAIIIGSIINLFGSSSVIILGSSAQGQVPTQINDLSFQHQRKLDVEVVILPVRSIDSVTQESPESSTPQPANANNKTAEPKALFYLNHDYTNTVNCEINVDVPVVSTNGRERVIRVNLGKQLIFPKAAFPDRRLSYDINVGSELRADERLVLNTKSVQKGAAICSGLKPTNRLPKDVCLSLNSNHENLCREFTSGVSDFYPISINNQFIGICSCD